MADERAATLRVIYQETCKTHNAIADFRAKLLALLPIASGTGVFLLLGKLNGGDRKLLLAVGLFGFIVTFGLFMYELRGIEDCSVLRRRGEAIEQVLGVHEEAGQFGNWLGGKGNVADEIGAAWIIYVAVLATWIFVAGAGVASFTGGFPQWAELVFGGVLGAVSVVVVVAALLPVKRGRLDWPGHNYWTERRAASKPRRRT